MPTQSPPITKRTEAKFVCECGDEVREACAGEKFYEQHEGKSYCVLHFPASKKLEAFRTALKKKFSAQKFNLKGVWFPEEACFRGFEFSAYANFSEAIFSQGADFFNATFRAGADFSRATFNTEANFYGAAFKAEADFLGVTFNAPADFPGVTFNAGADFSRTIFNGGVNFYKVIFSARADFYRATFNTRASFSGAAFGEDANFSRAALNAKGNFNRVTFSANADFSKAKLKDYLRFSGSVDKKIFSNNARINFQFALIEKPERVSFHTLYLKPHWFINADCRKFEFTDCDWNFGLKEELENASKAEINAPHRLLAIAYRQLADNAEANHRYHEASRFRYNAFEARRIETFGGFIPWRLDWWYWLASGYGENVGRAFIVFVALLALFAFGYGRCGFDQTWKASTNAAAAAVAATTTTPPDTIGKPLGTIEAFIYSAYVSILQKPDPKPVTSAAKLLVWLQTVLGPAQAALLALAVRRRFMR